jgi:hypothetical protein
MTTATLPKVTTNGELSAAIDGFIAGMAAAAPEAAPVGARKVDTTKGTMRSDVSAQWAKRPDDQKFTSLDALFAKTKGWADASEPLDTKVNMIEARGFDQGGVKDLDFYIGDKRVNTTNHAFGSIASLAGAPAGYLRTLPGKLAASNLNYGFASADDEEKQFYIMADL